MTQPIGEQISASFEQLPVFYARILSSMRKHRHADDIARAVSEECGFYRRDFETLAFRALMMLSGALPQPIHGMRTAVLYHFITTNLYPLDTPRPH